MDYFSLFQIPASLIVDAASIKKRFYELSRKYHPDFFGNSTKEDQEEALQQTALLNKAFKTLTNTDELLAYVLKENDLLLDNEKYMLPQDFLMEMIELNEKVMDAKMEDNLLVIDECKLLIITYQKTIYEPVKTIFENTTTATFTQEALLQVKEYYFKKKYLQRILDGL